MFKNDYSGKPKGGLFFQKKKEKNWTFFLMTWDLSFRGV
jgi:hypothetical protein